MLVVWLGALLFIGGLLYMAAQPIWRARLSGRPSPSPSAGQTLEPAQPGAGFRLTTNWPGLALLAIGAILMLIGAIV
jgi:hypothetical protein